VITIREAETPDRRAIETVVAEAFGRPEEADLVERLHADGDVVVSFVAEDGGEIVGHVLLSRMNAPIRALGLAPVSVRPDRQGEGVGGALIRAALQLARNDGWQGVFVLGNPDYYTRFGFDPALAAGFTSPYAGPYLMALSLEGDLPATSGRVEYAPAFAGLG
jgi:putative acetyltransferase